MVLPIAKKNTKFEADNSCDREKTHDGLKSLTWKELSYSIDRFCMILFTVIITFVTALFIGILASKGDQ